MPTIYGTTSDDNLTGSNSSIDFDSIFGYEGNDVIDGRNGDDFLDGGQGDDDIFGGEGRDTILGRDGNDTLKGGNHVDVLFGEAGDDWLWGGNDGDYLYGGDGNDTYLLYEDSSDQIVERAGQGIDTIIAYSSYTLAENLENLELVNNSLAITGTGNNSNNSIKGNRFNNTLYGWDGNDSLLGESGSDVLYGGLGDDVLIGDGTNSTSDTGFYRYNDRLYGGDGDDRLYGGRQADLLEGGAGRDYLNGFSDYDANEIDFLRGGTEGDTFALGYRTSLSSKIYYLDSKSGGRNKYAVIEDFSAAEGDRIRLGSSISEYNLVKNQNFRGSASLDTAIFRYGDLIAVVQDNTSITTANLYVG